MCQDWSPKRTVHSLAHRIARSQLVLSISLLDLESQEGLMELEG